MNGRTNSTTGQSDIDVTKSPFATLPPSDLVAVRGNQKIDLGWTNPVTEMATPGGYVVAKRAYTMVIRNDDHLPANGSDGIEIYRDTNTEDSSTGAHSDNDLINGHMYHYGFIAVTDNGVESEPACISMVPTMGVGYSGSIEPLSLEKTDGHWTDVQGRMDVATAGDKYAIFLALNGISERSPDDDYYYYISNINAYNVALTKQDIRLDQRYDDSYYSSRNVSTSSVSLGNYALFGLAGSEYRVAPTSVAVIDSNLTALSTVPKFYRDEANREGTAFNGYACWFSSNHDDNDYIQTYSDFDYLSESLTMSYINMSSVHGKAASGLRVVGEYLYIGPGWYKEITGAGYLVYEHDDSIAIVTKNWTVTHVQDEYPGGGTYDAYFQESAEDTTSNMFESTGTYALYANGGTRIQTVDAHGTIGMELTNPFNTRTSSHWSHGEYVIVFAQGSPGDCVAYDRYLTATYPSDVSQTHTNAVATSLQNHAIFGGANNNNVDVYSI